MRSRGGRGAYLIVAGVTASQLRRQHDGGNESENRCQDIHHEQDDWDSQSAVENGGYAKEPDDPAEGGREHGVVDGGGGADLAGQDVADQGGDEQDPDELEGADRELGFGDVDHGWGEAMACCACWLGIRELKR